VRRRDEAADQGRRRRPIVDAKFKTYGCGSAIASSSLATEWLKGTSVEQAAQIKNTQIVEELSLPPVKIHCSVLAEDAIKAAIDDWRQKPEALVIHRYLRRFLDEIDGAQH
jgi:NifU-like protein involved in Fe-S cluster formation